MCKAEARNQLAEAIQSGGPHTVESLAKALPDFSVEAIRIALESLAQVGVLEESAGADGEALYRYVDPGRYAWASHDVVADPAADGEPKSERRVE